jgi:hypothetical protein
VHAALDCSARFAARSMHGHAPLTTTLAAKGVFTAPGTSRLTLIRSGALQQSK